MIVASHRNPTTGGDIEVLFWGMPHDVFNPGKIKTAQSGSVSHVL
jgi:hypothetical protein